MGRFLFVVPPMADHVVPTVQVGRELVARGHRVAWTGHPEIVQRLLPDDAVFLPVDSAVPHQVRRAVAMRPTKGLRGPAALKFLWEDVTLPLAHSMVPGVRTAIHEFAPDVVVVDQQALAGAAVAQVLGVPWVTTMTTSVELAHPLGTMPLVARWIKGLLQDLMLDVGVAEDEAATIDPRFSPRLVVAFSTEQLMGSVAVPGDCAFVGPCLDDRPERPDRTDDTPFDWTWLDGRPLVVVASGGADRMGEGFLSVALECFFGMDAQAVVVGSPDLLPGAPDNVLVTPRVPRSALLAHAAAVVCHGDHGTVGESLANGVPLVVVPIRDDQPIVAQQVVDASAGVRVRFGRVHPDGLRRAVESALYEPRLRAGAAEVRDAVAGAGGPRRAADRIECLLGTTTLTATSLPMSARESA